VRSTADDGTSTTDDVDKRIDLVMSTTDDVVRSTTDDGTSTTDDVDKRIEHWKIIGIF